ncbi:MAG: prolyl oligopeptidase family serine peptidase, partial [Clostridia bacterium]|nr:prolyl oligopeptidase family serine peptidase [Clostridia bacterium]
SGAKEGTEQYKWFSLDKRVDKDCTPVFVWHTVTDDCVPVENTIKLVTALQKNGISYECHLLPEGGHGMSVCSKETGSFDAYNGKWVKLSIEWLNRIFDFEK